MLLAADLHIHTVLSPCASRDMTPEAIVREALRRGLGLIAVCDHNSAGNVEAVGLAAAACPEGPGVLPGIEITTREEVHVLGYFLSPRDARDVEEEVTRGMRVWQPLAACRFSLGETVELIQAHGGLAVAAHVDRPGFSVTGQLGFFPPDVAFDALEISSAGVTRRRDRDFQVQGCPLVSSSDAHFPEDIGGGITVLDVAEPGFEEMAWALRGIRGRRCVIA